MVMIPKEAEWKDKQMPFIVDQKEVKKQD